MLATAFALLAPQQQGPQPLAPLPTAQQVAWQELELCAFLHFGMNTFTDREWGEGSEDPKLFNPSALDCRQWVSVLKDAGFRGLILTAKHHDGFCLWPSAHTQHSVASSPWRDGKGDVVRELADACKEAGLKLGLYLSPWDRNARSYGDNDAYNRHYLAQLDELLTNYGPIFEVWWDGANGEGPNGKRQTYDWPAYIARVRKLQPEAVIFSDAGPDVRWVGNERGHAGLTCWSLFTTRDIVPGTSGIEERLNMGQIDGESWVPAESDVSIRPGWFFHPSENERVKPLDELLLIHERSVGRNSQLLLNVPPDTRGLIHELDAARLAEFGAALRTLYARDLARDARTESTATWLGYESARAVDGDPKTYWAAESGSRVGSIAVTLADEGVWIDRVVLREPIEMGQRVQRFRVQLIRPTKPGEGGFGQLIEGLTIGRKRIITFAPILARAVRVQVIDARAEPLIASIEAYAAHPRVTSSTRARAFVDSLDVVLAPDINGAQVHYTLDGSAPTSASALYERPIHLSSTTMVRATAFLGDVSSLQSFEATFHGYTKASLRDALSFFRAPDPGLRFKAYEGVDQSLDQLAGLEAVKEGVVEGFALEARTRDEQCALVFEGYVDVPKDDVWTFAARSDDGSRLWIHGELVADNDGLHAARTTEGSVGLKQGWHPIRVAWFNATGKSTLNVMWSTNGDPLAVIPNSALAR